MSEKINTNTDTKYDHEERKSTPIQEFYENQTIFITGGTGFIGKVLIEKLLRCCSGISRIYLLVRKKKDKDPHDRIHNLLKDSIFDRVRSSIPNFEKKIIGIAGDINLDNLGLSDDDIVLLKKDVSIIFHSAATVRLDEKLKITVATNLQSVITFIDLCKDMKNLKVFVYVSTAYAHCINNSTIEEKFYDYSINYKDLLLLTNTLSDETIEAITPLLIKSWMNTYTCTKASAESFLKAECQNLPVAIFRPVIVTSSAYEPMPGWTDNYNGATGIIAGVASGVIRTLHYNPQNQANFVPVDLTVNALIASAWDVAMQTTRKGEHMLIYNFTSSSEAPFTSKMVVELSLKYIRKYPLNMALWYASLQVTKSELTHKFHRYLFHWIPALLIDLLARSIGRKPRMTKIYEKVHKLIDLLNYVGTNNIEVENDNVRSLWDKLDSHDQSMFRFTMQNFDWDKYFSTYVKGIRIYLFKDDLKTLDTSRARYKKLFWINRTLQAALIVSTYYTLRKILEIRRRYKPLYYYNKRCYFT